MKKAKLLLAVLVVVSMITGSISASADGIGAVKDEINIAMTAEPSVYDVMTSTSVAARMAVCGTVYEQLVTLNGNSEPVPELCETYEINDNATEFVFHLRKGVVFHNGSEMTADDVVASLNRWVDNYGAVQKLVGDARFEATGENTVSIKTTSPAVTLVYLMAGGAQRAVITTKEATQDVNDSGKMNTVIGTGPYKMTEWVTDQYTILERFDDYCPYGDPDEVCDGWAGYKHAYTKKITYWVVPEEATRAAGLQTGQFDSANIGDATLPALKNSDSIVIHSEEGGQNALVFNKKEGLCADVNIRKAVNAIIDADELSIVKDGFNYITDSSYMESFQQMWYVDTADINYNTMDYEAAANYLKEADYQGETLRILCSSANNFDKIAQILEMELEAQGINCEITTVDWGTFTEYRNDPAVYDIFVSSFSNVPLPSLKAYFGTTYAGWTDDETLNAMWEKYNNAVSLEEAAKIWEEIQVHCWDYLPLISLSHYVSNDAMNAAMEGVIYQNGAYYWNAYIPA